MKPGTFTQLYIHLVFAVKYRQSLLHDAIRPRIFEYLSGILTNLKHKSMIINGMPDHAHILFGLHQNESVSDTVQAVKRGSALWINQERFFPGQFAWQEGYGAFSYSRSQLDNIYQYIKNQAEHHRKHTFREEYLDFLEKFAIEYDARFLFEFFADPPTPTG